MSSSAGVLVFVVAACGRTSVGLDDLVAGDDGAGATSGASGTTGVGGTPSTGGTGGAGGAATAGSPSGGTAGSAVPLPECLAREPRVGVCIRPRDQPSGFGEGTSFFATHVWGIGESFADPECFSASNTGRVVPARFADDGSGLPPHGLTWLRVIDTYAHLWSVGIAAPGVENLRIEMGDVVQIVSSMTWRNAYAGIGTVELHVENRGRIYVSLNQPDTFRIQQGPIECERRGPCPGFEWTMLLQRDYVDAAVPVGASTAADQWTFTNDRAFRHADGYVEPAANRLGACGWPMSETLVSAVFVEPSTVAPAP